MWINFLWVIVALFLVFLNALFVAAEFGMVRLRHTRIETIKKKRGLRGRILSQIHQRLDAYLSACQVGITLASLGLGWIGEPAFGELLDPLFQQFQNISAETARFISFAVAFSIISFLHIVVGELVPKSLAIRQSEGVSLWTALPLYIFYWMMYPMIWLLNTCSNFILKISGLSATHEHEAFHSTEEIKLILNASHSHGELTEEETEIIEHTLDLADLKVTDVMRPIEEMIMLETAQPIQKTLKTIAEKRYSRYPVYDKKKQDVRGIIHIKDLYSAFYKEGKIPSLEPYMRPILKVYHRLPALDLLRKFREGMPHFALIYKRKNELIGFITLDNLLHVLVGKIQDEFHKTRDDWVYNKDGSFSIKGGRSVYLLERALDLDLPLSEEEEEKIDTVDDFVRNYLKRPKSGDKISFDDFDVFIETMEGKHIGKIKVYPKKKHFL